MVKPTASGKNKWTEGRLRAFIISVLRKGMLKYPPKYETLNKAKVGKKINEKTKRMAMHYKCNKCKGHFTSSQVQVDHKKPVVDPKQGFISWDEYIKRLFCGAENLQVLCKPDHKEKTDREKKRRTKK